MEKEKDTIILKIDKEQEYELEKLCIILNLTNIDNHINSFLFV